MNKMIKILLIVFGFLLVSVFVSEKFKKTEPATPGTVSKESVSVSTVPVVSRPLYDKNLTPEQIAALYGSEWGVTTPVTREDGVDLTVALFEYYICKSIQKKSFVPCNVMKVETSTPHWGQGDYWHWISDTGDQCDWGSAALRLANAYAFGRLGLDDCEKYLKAMSYMEDYMKPNSRKAPEFSERTFCKAIINGWKDGGRTAACALVSAKGYVTEETCRLIFPMKDADCRLRGKKIGDCEFVLSGFQASVAKDPDKCSSYLHAGCEYMVKKDPAVCDAVAKRLAELYKRYRNRPVTDTSANSS